MTNGTTFSTLATLAANTISYTDTSVVSAGEYYYRVVGTATLTKSADEIVSRAAAPSASPPRAPWLSQDIGTAYGPGTTAYSNGTFKLVTSTRSASASKSIRFTSQPMAGDGQITARVATFENTGAAAKVGVMIRQSTAAAAVNAFLYVTPTGIGFSYRASDGDPTTTVATVAGTARWLRLVRSGNVFTAVYSSNGTNWTTLGTATVVMTSDAHLDLATTAGSATLINTSTLDNVSVIP